MIYDEIIVGSGPCSYAYLMGITNTERRRLLITSDVVTLSEKQFVRHPKLCNEHYSHVELEKTAFPITSSFGGLSNCWGGVLVNGGIIDYLSMFPDAMTDRTIEFNSMVDKLIDDLQISHVVHKEIDGDRYIYLLDSTQAYGWESSKLSVSEDIKRLAHKNNVEIMNRVKVDGFIKENSIFKVSLRGHTKQEVLTKRLVLACGVPGNKNLLERSSVEVSYINDHTPFQVACLAREKKVNELSFATKGTPVKKVIGTGRKFISIYDPKEISDLSMKKLAGIAGMVAKRFKFFGYRIYLCQIWNDDTYSFKNSNPFYRFTSVFKTFVNVTSGVFYPIFFQTTKVGEGFHYQAFIDKNIEGLVLLGGIGSKALPVYHPTFMYMINAMDLARNETNQ